MGNELQKSMGAVASKSLPLFDPLTLVIVTDEGHPLFDERATMPVDKALVKSIKVHGVIEPIVVRKNGVDGDGNPVIEVVDGRQRVAAARLANEELEAEGEKPVRVPGVTRTGDELKLMGVMVAANEIRKGDAIVVKCRKVQRMIDRGATEEDIAVDFGVNVTTIKNYIALLECDKSVLAAVGAGKCTADVARKLKDLSKEDQRKALADMIEKGATKGRKAQKAVAQHTGQKNKVGLGKKQIKHMILELRAASKLTDVIEEEKKLEFGALVLEYVLGTGDQPFESPPSDALIGPETEETEEGEGSEIKAGDAEQPAPRRRGRPKGSKKGAKKAAKKKPTKA